MQHRGARRSTPSNVWLRESIAVYLKLQRAATEKEFAALLAEHDRLTDADGKPRLRARTLAEFRSFSNIPP